MDMKFVRKKFISEI